MGIGSTTPNAPSVPTSENNLRYRVSYFDSAVHVDQEIAETHLAVRRWQVDVQGVAFSNFHESWDELNDINKSYVRPGGNFFVAENLADGQVIGHVGIMNRGDREGALKRMGILPDYHRRGVGASLVMMALAWAQSSDLTRITLNTGVIENAKPFYEKFGFAEIGRVLRNQDYVMELLLESEASE